MIIGLLIGFAVGFIFSMPPLGPTYFAVIDRGLKKQEKNGFMIGAGAGFMDMIYILIAYGGMAAIISLLPDAVNRFFTENEELLKIFLAVAGCIAVILYGIKIMKTKSNVQLQANNEKENDEKFSKKYHKVENVLKKTDKILHTRTTERHTDLTGSFLIGVVMCLSSVTLPASWFATVGYLKSYGLIDSSFLTGVLLGIGVFLGTVVWFYVMTKFISRNSDKIKPTMLNKLNMFTGVFLILLGGGFLVKIATMYL